MPLTMIPGSQILDGSITDADVDAAAAIDGSKLAVASVPASQLAGGAAAGNIAAGELDGSVIADGTLPGVKLASGAAAGNIAVSELDGSVITDGTLPGVKLASGAAAGNIVAGEITASMLAGGVDISSQTTGNLAKNRIDLTTGTLLVGTASIGSELTLTPGQIIVGDASGNVAAVTMSGDATIDSDGVVTVAPSGATIVDNEIPAGTINGTNPTFTLAQAPAAGSEHVYLNGLRQSLTDDYTIAGDVITFTGAPASGSHILVDYRY